METGPALYLLVNVWGQLQAWRTASPARAFSLWWAWVDFHKDGGSVAGVATLYWVVTLPFYYTKRFGWIIPFNPYSTLRRMKFIVLVFLRERIRGLERIRSSKLKAVILTLKKEVCCVCSSCSRNHLWEPVRAFLWENSNQDVTDGTHVTV